MLPPFKILNANSVTDAVKELRRFGDEAKIYAGGTELFILLRHNLIQTKYLLNIKPIGELNAIRRVNGAVSIGASITHRRLEVDPTIREMLPMLAGAESQVANIRVRSQGTIGGNLCFNDPHSDPATVLLVHDAAVHIAGADGRKQLPLQQFLVGMYSTALAPDELLVSVDVPRLPVEFGSSYLRIHRLQRPTLGVAAAASLKNGALARVRLAVGCVGPKAVRLTDLEEKLVGTDANALHKTIDESKSYLTKLLDPIDDLLGSADYKIYITGVLLERALQQSVQNAERKHGGTNV